MPKSAWPTATELTNALTGLDTALPSGFTAADVIAGAIRQFESDSGFRPFLAETSDVAMRYDPPFGFDLQVLPYWTVSEVRIDVEGAGTGTVLTAGVDYWLRPERASGDKQPVNSIKFRVPVTGKPSSVQVTGRRGYADQIPDDVWNAVLRLGLAYAMAAAQGFSGSISEVKSGLVDVKYSNEAGRSTFDRFVAEYKAVAMRYRMPRFV